MSTVKGPLMRLILTVTHITPLALAQNSNTSNTTHRSFERGSDGLWGLGFKVLEGGGGGPKFEVWDLRLLGLKFMVFLTTPRIIGFTPG